MEEDKLTAIAIGFSTEEILILMDYFGGAELHGVSDKALKNLSDEQRKLVQEIARRSLIARQMLLKIDGKWQPHPLIYNLLLPCIAPEHSIIISTQNQLSTRNYSIYCLKNNQVLYWVNSEGIYQFVLLPAKEAIQVVLSKMVKIPSSQEIKAVGFVVDTSPFNAARKVSDKQNYGPITEFLIHQHISTQAAESIAHSLSNPAEQYSIAAWHHAVNPVSPQFSIMATNGDTGSWLFVKLDQDKLASKVNITPFTSLKMLDIIDKFVKGIQS